MNRDTLRSDKQKNALKREWPLLVFSLFTTLLVSVFYVLFNKGLPLKTEFFFGGLFVGAVLILLDLARNSQTRKALLDSWKSWLGRGIIAYFLFVILAAFWLVFPNQNELGLLAAILGLLTLVSIDNTYREYPSKAQNKYHSADVLFFTAFLYVAILVSNPWMFFAALALKGYLYISRKIMFKNEEKDIRPVFSSLRILLGFVIPVALFFLFGFGTFNYFMLISVVLGEAIDRIEFYLEL